MALAALGFYQAHAQTPAVRSLLIDFGVNDGTNGNSTLSPDANGSYWNNLLHNTGMADTSPFRRGVGGEAPTLG